MPEFDPSTLPGFTRKRRSPIESFLQDLPIPELSAAAPAQVAPIPSPIPDKLDPAYESLNLPANALKQPRSLSSDLQSTLPRPPARLDALQNQYNAIGQESIGQKIARAIATFAPVAIAGKLGGTYAAAGAAQGGAEATDIRREQGNLQRRSLLQEMENERQRQERMAERELSGQIALGGQAERMAATKAIVAGRQGVADTGAAARSLAAELGAGARGAQTDAMLRTKGFKRDDQGNIVPLEESEMSAAQKQDLTDKQNLVDYRKAATDLATARAEFERTKSDPNSPQYKLAAQRLALTQQIHDTAAQRLGLSQQQFEMRAFGTNKGEPLPGTLQTDTGQTVGTAFQQNIRPTNVERNKADMASSAREQLGDIVTIVTKHPEIFGPGHGRATEVTNWIGSEDPDAKRFKSARTIAGDHLAGTFGGRSEPALAAIDDAIGQFKDNPDAMLAGIGQIDKAAKLFEDRGKVKATGTKAGGAKTLKFNPATRRVE